MTPATAVVAGMDTGNVDTVVIAGRVMKRHGELLHVDWPAVRRMATESRDYVVAKSGFKSPEHLMEETASLDAGETLR